MVESGIVRLSDLFRDVPGFRVVGDPSTTVSYLSYRSAEAGPGHLFFCVPGFTRDGHDYAAEAMERGAVALCVERELDLDVPQVVVPSVRWAMGPVASVLHEYPSARLAVVGVTGTNGKTTSAFLTAFLLNESGRRAGLLGTVERRIGGMIFPAERTTPEAVDIQQDLAMMVDAGDQAGVLEISSHALDLGRAAGITFAVVAFTNLTQDHLDFHQTFDAYYSAKSRLFLDPMFARSRPVAAVNVGDPFGALLAERLPPDRLLSFAVRLEGTEALDGGSGPELDMQLTDVVMGPGGSRGKLVLAGRAAAAVLRLQGRPVVRGEELARDVQTGLVGRFNLANVLTALGIGIGLGLDLDTMIDALPLFPGVPGRMERVDAGQPFAVVVDYAHTPDSVENVLRTARQVAQGRLIAVLGCGGNRDRGKRPKMARVAEKVADIVVLTSDNPRSEEPQAILHDMIAGLANPERTHVDVDRRRAIAQALSLAAPDDVVMILGKGHERGQEFAGVTLPFDDRQVARELLEELVAGGGGIP